MTSVPDLGTWLLHWRYAALATVVLLGNVGLPVPEETALILAGYLVREGHLALGPTLAVGIASAVVGDNLGYWLGRRWGRSVVLRGARWARITPARLDRIQTFVMRYGGLAVVAARFVTGVRMLAGPLAGASGMRPLLFMAANLVGAVLFVPYALMLGYAVGHGLDAVGPRARAEIETHPWWLLAGAATIALVLAIAVALARRRRPPGDRAHAP